MTRSTSPRAVAEWVVSIAVPMVLRKLGCPDEAGTMERVGCGPSAVATARVVLAKDAGDPSPMASARRRAASIAISAVEVHDLAPKVAFQEPILKRAESLAREVGALAGMAWQGGGDA